MAYSNQSRGQHEPIAIIGMGCRFAGTPDVESFWRVLRDGKETVGEYPGGRSPYLDTFYDPASPNSSRIITRRGGFVEDIDRFDAQFFGISPREAALLDPQQRILLEVAWQAFDNAGLVREQIAGSRTAVFAGVWNSDYENWLYRSLPEVDLHCTTGTGRYAVSGRLSYFFDLRGPNLTVDTACSSGLVAVHLACQSLWAGESEMALAGGVNVILRPEITLAYSAAGMLSPDGRCKFGDASADGYVRSEGAAMVVLKPLSSALADGDPVHAVIRGTAINNDGQSGRLLVAPSGPGHEAVIRAALASAGMSPDGLDYVEAHGTGTHKGDPIEIAAIGAVLASSGTRSAACLVGSVKTNIGHTESVSGVAGLIKVALALKHRTIPASLHFRNGNPEIPWGDLPVAIPAATMPWPAHSHVPAGGVSSLGITGTNAHVILEAAPAAGAPVRQADSRTCLLTLSSQSEEGLRSLAETWRGGLAQNGSLAGSSLQDLCFTASVRRTQHESRLAIATVSHSDLDRQLAAWLEGEECEGVVSARRRTDPPRTVFVFPGQGGHWLGMGWGLLRDEPVFRRVVEQCDVLIRRHTGWSVLERLSVSGDAERMQEIDTVQPVLFAFCVALAELWRAWGVEPQAVVGHSMGEVAAAVVAGALSPEDGAAVIVHRSRLMKRTSGRGLMALTGLDIKSAGELVEPYRGRVSVAAHNSPGSTVLSGDADAIEELLAALESRQIFCRRIKVDVASHSPHMQPLAGELEEALHGIRPRRGALPLYSTSSGEIEDGTRLSAEYWGRNLRRPVLFAPAIERLLAGGFNTFLEIGPHPVLTPALDETIRDSGREALSIPSLRREKDERTEMLTALGALYTAGYPVDFRRICEEGACVSLPAYPWQRERYWIETGSAEEGLVPGTGTINTPAQPRAAADDMYELRWAAAPQLRAAQAREQQTGRWILLADAEGCCDRLADELEAMGQSCVRIYAGESYGRRSPGRYVVHPDHPEDLDRVMAECSDEAGAPCQGVVHFWGIDHAANPNLSSIWHAQQAGSFSALRIVQALARWNPPQAPRLWLVTADAMGPGAHSGFAQSPLWGFGRVAAREHPELRCTNVDIGDGSVAELRSLAALLCGDAPEDRIVLRSSDCFVARYERSPQRDTASPALAGDATYMITGGTGGIGPVVARWMVERGARTLVLVARRPPSQEGQTEIADLEAAGATVRFLAADLADEQQTAGLIETIRETMPPLRGICHLAVAAEGCLLMNADEEHFRRVMAPKIAGAWNLHTATLGLPLDFFVLFSSVAAVISQPGQGSYAAANSFLDGLAAFRRANSLAALSLQWGPWAGLGLATRQGPQRSVQAYEKQGITPLPVAAALAALDRAMMQPAATLLVLPVDWPKFSNALEGEISSRAFLSLTAGSKRDGGQNIATDLRERLLSAEPGRSRVALLEAFLREQLGRVIKLPAARIDSHRPMGAMGVDSLMGLEFVRRLASATAVRLPATAIFNFPTIHALGAELARRMGIPLEGPALSQPARAPSPLRRAEVQDLSEMTDDDAVRALLGATEERQ